MPGKFSRGQLVRNSSAAQRCQDTEVAAVQVDLFVSIGERLLEDRPQSHDSPGDLLGGGIQLGSLDPPLGDDGVDRVPTIVTLIVTLTVIV